MLSPMPSPHTVAQPASAQNVASPPYPCSPTAASTPPGELRIPCLCSAFSAFRGACSCSHWLPLPSDTYTLLNGYVQLALHGVVKGAAPSSCQGKRPASLAEIVMHSDDCCRPPAPWLTGHACGPPSWSYSLQQRGVCACLWLCRHGVPRAPPVRQQQRASVAPTLTGLLSSNLPRHAGYAGDVLSVCTWPWRLNEGHHWASPDFIPVHVRAAKLTLS